MRSITTGAGQTEYTPIGHTTNLASRIQLLAPIGSIAATEQVRKLCEGYFVLKPLGPTRVKGVSEPVNVYEVTGFGPLRTRLQRAAGRGLTKFVGREREMEALKHAAEQAKSGHGQIMEAMAEPGVGKSPCPCASTPAMRNCAARPSPHLLINHFATRRQLQAQTQQVPHQ